MLHSDVTKDVTAVKNALKIFSLHLVVTLQSQPHECLASQLFQRLEVILMTQNQLAEREGEREI